jgi:DNA ligase-1
MEYVVYDALPDWAFCAGRYEATYAGRFANVEGYLERCEPGEGQVWLTGNEAAAGRDVMQWANKLAAQGGYDGLILRDPNAIWAAGPARKGELVKVKPTTSLDLVVTDVMQESGAKTGRPVYTLEVSYRGALTRVGSGVPHILPSGLSIGAIVEIECMAVNPNNTLREPRFKGLRWDKERPDE